MFYVSKNVHNLTMQCSNLFTVKTNQYNAEQCSNLCLLDDTITVRNNSISLLQPINTQ